jgi:hypothetical protein
MPIVQARSFATADPEFEQELATRHQPLIVGSLGHELAPDAPSGVVSGLAEPSPSNGPSRKPVQRTFAPPPGWLPSRQPTSSQESPVGVIHAPETAPHHPGSDLVVPATSVSRTLVEASTVPIPAVPISTISSSEIAADHQPATSAEPTPDRGAQALVPLATQRALLDDMPSTASDQPGPTEHGTGTVHREPPAPAIRTTASESVPHTAADEGSPPPPLAPTVMQSSRPTTPQVQRTSTERAGPLTRAVAEPIVASPTFAAVPPRAPDESAPRSLQRRDGDPPSPAPSPAEVSPTEAFAPVTDATPAGEVDVDRVTESHGDSVAAPIDGDAVTVLPLLGDPSAAPLATAPAQSTGSEKPVSDSARPSPVTSAGWTAVQRRTMVGSPVDRHGDPRALSNEPGVAGPAGPPSATRAGSASESATAGSVDARPLVGSVATPSSGVAPSIVARSVISSTVSAGVAEATASPRPDVSAPTAVGEARPLVPVSREPVNAGPSPAVVARGPVDAAVSPAAISRPAVETVMPPTVVARTRMGPPTPAGSAGTFTPRVARLPDVPPRSPPAHTTRPEPILTSDGHPSVVVSLLAERPLVPTIDGAHSEPVGQSSPVDAASAAPSDLLRPPHRTSGRVDSGGGRATDGRLTLQRLPVPASITSPRASAAPPRTGSAFGFGAASIVHQPKAQPTVLGGFVPAEDGTLWALDDPLAAPPAPLVHAQRQEAASGAEPEPGTPAPETTTAVATAGPAAAATAPEAGAPKSEGELQELCRALYPRLRRSLCRDLLLDRERVGYRTDIRY